MDLVFSSLPQFRKATPYRFVERKKRVRHYIPQTPVDVAINKLRKRLEQYYKDGKRTIENILNTARDMPQIRYMDMNVLATVIFFMNKYHVQPLSADEKSELVPRRQGLRTVEEFFEEKIYEEAVKTLIGNLKLNEDELVEEITPKIISDFYRYMVAYYQFLEQL